jgi:hypothetical protein
MVGFLEAASARSGEAPTRQGERNVTTHKKRPTRNAGIIGHSRRVKTRNPSLQMTSSERHTHWTCPVCRAVGTVDHAAGSSDEAILALVRQQHAIKQPNCGAL